MQLKRDGMLFPKQVNYDIVFFPVESSFLKYIGNNKNYVLANCNTWQ